MSVHGNKITLDNDVNRASRLQVWQRRHRDFTDILSCRVKRGILQQQGVTSANLSVILCLKENEKIYKLFCNNHITEMSAIPGYNNDKKNKPNGIIAYNSTFQWVKRMRVILVTCVQDMTFGSLACSA